MKALKMLHVRGLIEGDYQLQVNEPEQNWFKRLSPDVKVAEPFGWLYACRVKQVRYHVSVKGAGKTEAYWSSRHPSHVLQSLLEKKERQRLEATLQWSTLEPFDGVSLPYPGDFVAILVSNWILTVHNEEAALQIFSISVNSVIQLSIINDEHTLSYLASSNYVA